MKLDINYVSGEESEKWVDEVLSIPPKMKEELKYLSPVNSFSEPRGIAKENRNGKNSFKAMDSDMHVFEPADLWQRYIDKKYLDRAPKGLNRTFRDLGIEVDGKDPADTAPAGKPRAGEIPSRLLRREIRRSRQT